MISLERLVVGSFRTNCYILKSNKEGVIIDPGDNASQIKKNIKDLKTKYILLTHLHFDHLEALEEIQKETKIKIGLNKNDLLAKEDLFINTNFLEKNYDLIFFLKESDLLSLNSTKIKVLETPGHTPGGISFYIEKEGIIISGDTLFKNSVGRTDLPCSNQENIEKSLKKILSLPDETIVYPGHGEETTVKAEKKNFM